MTRHPRLGRTGHPLASAVCLVLVVTGCGGATSTLGQSTPTATPSSSPAACAPTQLETRFLVDLAESYPVWFRASGLAPLAPEPTNPDQPEGSVASAEDDRTRYRPVGAQALRSNEVPATLTAPTNITDEALPGPGQLVVAVSQGDFGALFVRLTDSGPSFFGNCASERAGREFARYAAEENLDAAASNDALLALIASPRGPEAAALRRKVTPAGQVPWTELPADERFLDPEARPPAPEAVLRSVERVPTMLSLPAKWATYPYSICTRVDEGWGECSALTAADTSSGVAVLPLLTYATARGRTEFWIVPEDGSVARRLGRVMSLPPGFERAQGLRLRGEGDYDTPAKFADAARRGAPLLAPGR